MAMNPDEHKTISVEQYTIEVADNPDFKDSRFLIPVGNREDTLNRLLILKAAGTDGTEHYRMVVRIVMTSGWEVV